MDVDRCEDRFSQMMLFQQMAKFEQCRRIRRGFSIQTNAEKRRIA